MSTFPVPDSRESLSSASESTSIVLSVVIPCLNEAETLPSVVSELRQILDSSEWSGLYEVVVADNGSTDDSSALAMQAGARVIHVNVRGYGAALRGGIQDSHGRIIVMLDADSTYDAESLPRLVHCLEETPCDLVIGTRLRGQIDGGAMPFLHRYLGTPFLTWLINAIWKSHLSDSNSGMRAFHREAFLRWSIESAGWEFASEMLLTVLSMDGRICEVPIHLRADPLLRIPHLQRWRDGMRNMLLILSRAPLVFYEIGKRALAISVLLAILTLLGPFKIGVFDLFGYHTLIIATLAGFLGTQSLLYGLFLSLATHRNPTDIIGRFLVNVNEGVLFWLLFAIGVTNLILLIVLFADWYIHGFSTLNLLHFSLYILYAITNLGSIAFGSLHIHIMKRVLDRHQSTSP